MAVEVHGRAGSYSNGKLNLQFMINFWHMSNLFLKSNIVWTHGIFMYKIKKKNEAITSLLYFYMQFYIKRKFLQGYIKIQNCQFNELQFTLE